MHALDIDNEIALQIAYFVAEVKAFSAMHRTDINRVAQNVFVPIFNEIYGYSRDSSAISTAPASIAKLFRA